MHENTPVLQTERLILRPFIPEDLDDFFEILRDPEVNRFLPWFPAKTREDAEKFLEERYLRYYREEPSAYRYAICLRADNRPIGHLALSNGDSRDLGYGLHRDFWGRGIATEAAKALIDHLRTTGIPFVTATHDRDNPKSGEVMRRLGMRYCYSYLEQWQPKDIPVTFRMYQLNFDNSNAVYLHYWNQYPEHCVEPGL